jgi:hypothetical protein
MASINIYTEEITYDLSDEDIQAIESQMIKEFPITVHPNHIYMINGERHRLSGLWGSYNPLANIYYVLTGKMTNEKFATFDGSATDLLCKQIHNKHIKNYMQKIKEENY